MGPGGAGVTIDYHYYISIDIIIIDYFQILGELFST